MSSLSVDDPMRCKACLNTMSPPIIQCEKGDSICGNCAKKSSKAKQCPLCGQPLTKTRNRQLEELIKKLKQVTLKASCKYANRGCKYELNLDEKKTHEAECKSRLYECEGKIYCEWDCDWTGVYVDIMSHFKDSHPGHCWMEFKSEFSMRISMQSDLKDIQIIDFHSGQQRFWYKHKTDINKKKAYWAIQYVGLKKQAAQYYYEFEMHNGVRKFKITEICENDCEDAEAIFSSGKCIAVPFKIIRSYLDEDGELPIRFRIMKVKKDSAGSH